MVSLDVISSVKSLELNSIALVPEVSCLTADMEDLVNHTNRTIYSGFFFNITYMPHGCSIFFNAIANTHGKHLEVLSYNS